MSESTVQKINGEFIFEKFVMVLNYISCIGGAYILISGIWTLAGL